MTRCMNSATTVLLVILVVGCDQPVNTATLHLRRPVDMAIVCLQETDDVTTAVPLESCEETDGAVRHGFVMNSERGSISRVDLETGKFIDDDDFIPGFSPTLLDGRPLVAVAAPDSTAVYIANSTLPGITRVNSIAADGYFLQVDQRLPSAPSDLVVANDELWVALPDEGAVARIPLAEFGGLAALDNFPMPEGSPYDLAATADGQTLYVGHAGVAWMSVVDVATAAEVARIPLADPCFDDLDNNGDGLFDSADWGCRVNPELGERTEPADSAVFTRVLLQVPNDAPACADGIDNDGDGATDFPDDPTCMRQTSAHEGDGAPVPVLARIALSPDEGLIYASNSRTGAIVVVDPVAKERVDVNSPKYLGANPLFRELGRRDIELSATFSISDLIMTAGTVVREDGSEFDRRTAWLASANGNVLMIEVDDLQGRPMHRLRDLNDDSTTPVPSAPQLFDDAGPIRLGGDRRPELPSFGEYLLDPTYSLTVSDDPRVARGETWDVTNGGTILRRDMRIGQFDFSGLEPVFETPEPIFCTAGVEVGDRLVLTYEAVNAPGVLNPADCSEFSGRTFSWTIDAIDQHRLTLAPNSGMVLNSISDDDDAFVSASVPDPNSECFSGAMTYSIRVPLGTYAVVGGVSGYLHPWRGADDGSCELDPTARAEWKGRAAEWTLAPEQIVTSCPPSNEEADVWFEGTYFENHALRFRLIPGCEVDEEGTISVLTTAERVRWRFNVTDAFTIRTTQLCSGGDASACVTASYGYPRALRWSKDENLIYVIDSGQQKLAPISAISGRGSVEFF
ncbi:MAG: hypothetical protein VX223_13370 [Myxococcota bacterium]|nr:hypothetical protein [Myxococcota bacterium]